MPQEATLDSPCADRVLILGDGAGLEMTLVTAAVVRHAPECPLERVRDVAGLRKLVTVRGWHPDLVVVCQRWPDEFAASEVAELLALLPLARWVCCYGAWCESDGRNRVVWPAAARVPLHRVAARIREELRVLRGERQAIPWTASRDEVFAFDFTDACGADSQSVQAPSDAPAGRERSCSDGSEIRPADALPEGAHPAVLVNSPDRALRSWLEDLVVSAGCRLIGRGGEHPPTVIVWDADPWDEQAAAALRALAFRHPAARIIALAGFARPEDGAALHQHGAAAVLPKPVKNRELLRAVSGS